MYGGGGSSDVSGADGLSVPRPAADQPEYPQSFHEVMEMVQQGRTPPNVRVRKRARRSLRQGREERVVPSTAEAGRGCSASFCGGGRGLCRRRVP